MEEREKGAARESTEKWRHRGGERFRKKRIQLRKLQSLDRKSVV